MPGITILEQIQLDELVRENLKKYNEIIEKAYEEFILTGKSDLLEEIIPCQD